MKRMFASIALALLWLTAVPAHAADEIGVSNDGVNWAETLPDPLFDPEFRWVPGDNETASFFVRNQGPTDAWLTLTARGVDDGDRLLASDDIDLRARVVGERWATLENGTASQSLAQDAIAQGGVVEVQVNVQFDPASTNQSQQDFLRVLFDVNLTEDVPGVGPGDPGSGGSGPVTGGGPLAATGGPALWLLVTSGALLGTGFAVARRRDCEGVDHGET